MVNGRDDDEDEGGEDEKATVIEFVTSSSVKVNTFFSDEDGVVGMTALVGVVVDYK